MYVPNSGVHPMYMARRPQPQPKRPQFRRTFIRQWREHRDLTLEQLAERVRAINEALETTHASLSRIERGLQPYNQPLLEAIAEALQTDPPSLLMRDPSSAEDIWSVWDQAKPGERKTIVDIAKTIVKAAS
jgi:transcriptional regulator with XRE-family HTH domain